MKHRVTHELAASLGARVLSGGLQFLFTPVYVALLGIESYGLVGFYLVLVGTLLFLDQAVSPIVTRQFASSMYDDSLRTRLPDVLKTMEFVSIGTGLFVAALVALTAPWLASKLLNPAMISTGEAVVSIRIMALMIAFQWPSYSYAGAMAGLKQQVRLNGVRAAVGVVQWGGGAIVLWLKADVIALFTWQTMCFAVQTSALAALVHSAVRQGEGKKAKFNRNVLLESWRFGLGALMIGITGTILTQADKIVVMRHSALADFSIYSLTFTIASLIQVFIAQPVTAIAYPHFASLVALADEQRLATEYCNWTQAVVLVVVPITAVFVFFPEPLLRLWFAHNESAVAQCRLYLPWIALGTMFNVIMMLPLCLQMASGWTALSSLKNLMLIPPFLATLLLLVPRYGPIVGAICWLAINFSYYLVEVPIMHRRLLRPVLWDWWLKHTLRPAAITMMLFGVISVYMDQLHLGDHATLIAAGATTSVTGLLLILTQPFLRTTLLSFLARK